MSKYYYNGVLLPEIPADVLVKYPYIALVNRPSSGLRMEFSTKPKYVYWLDSAQAFYCRAENGNIGYLTYTEGNSDWDEDRHEEENDFYLSLGEYLAWSNHDIRNGSPTATNIYYHASEPVPYPDLVFEDYTIKRESLTAIGDAIRAKTGKTELLSLDSMVTEISGIKGGTNGFETIASTKTIKYIKSELTIDAGTIAKEDS